MGRNFSVAPFSFASMEAASRIRKRKTTLKWTVEGELSAVDMARILDRLTKPELSQCDLACDVDDALSDKETKTPFKADPLPVSAWLP